ncbi:MAG: methyltransferase domain-containing protein [Deltaproteobacteria bacterium]|nr:methyltransferase domain-containing protein [Deltaproteobacteria bacterium]
MHSHRHGPATTGRTIHWARWYDAVTGLLLFGAERPSRTVALELAGLKAGDRVLDLGCGTGNLALAAKAISGPQGEVYGIDAAPEMIDVARQKAARAGVAVDFRVALAEALPFPAAYFDVVVSRLVLHHLPAELQRTAFAEVCRVLRPGGGFAALDFAAPQSPLLRALATALVGHEMLRSSIAALPPVLTAAGFRDVEFGPTGYRMLSFIRGWKP